MKVSEKKLLSASILVFSLLVLALIFIYIFYLAPHFISESNFANQKEAERDYHILLVGDSENQGNLESIYIGASRICGHYNSVVEILASSNQTGANSIQGLLDYGQYIKADGIIACLNSENENLVPPLDEGRAAIPIVTVSHYNPRLPQISYIGTNNSELGRKIAEESRNYLHGNGSLLVINSNTENNPNYSNLMASLKQTLEVYSEIRASVVDLDFPENLEDNKDSLKSAIGQFSPQLLVCLTVEDTIRTAQIISELRTKGKIGILGLGTNEIAEKYLESGLITELLVIDWEKIGETAVQELAEYLTYGYANSYVNADVSVHKKVAGL